MAKKARERTTKVAPGARTAIRERLNALDDAVDAAVGAVADHVGLSAAVSTVTTGLFMSAAGMVWHITSVSEAEFVETARRCYQRIAETHANCERSGDSESGPHRHAREDLN